MESSNLPMLASIHLEQVEGINQLVLNAPKLSKIKLLDFHFLFRLEQMVYLEYCDQINAEVIRKAFEKLQFLF